MVKIMQIFVVFVIVTAFFCNSSAALDNIQYPGEEGFFIGESIPYVISADSSNEENVGKPGMFTFGPGLITIDGQEYYDGIFDSGEWSAHFYQSIDPIKEDLVQKGFKFGETELTLNPVVTAIDYPLASGDTWSEETELTAKNVEIPGFGLILFPIEVKGVKAENTVSSVTVSVPAGNFDTLLVESTFTGSMLGIPMTLIQSTWLDENNVSVKRRFELTSQGSELMLYELQLSGIDPTPWDLNRDGSVDILDVVIIAKHIGGSVDDSIIPSPDIDGNGIVDTDDMRVVAFHFGETYDQ